MKKWLIILIVMIVGVPLIITAQKFTERNTGEGNGIRKLENIAFTFGEKLVYKVRYNLYLNVPVGEVSFEVKKEPSTVLGKDCYHIVSKGRTYGFYDPFYKVRDRYESYLSSDNLLPKVFIRIVNEGGYKFNERVVFYHEKNAVKNNEDKMQRIPDNTQDVLSALYVARTYDFQNAAVGDSVMVHTYIDDTTYTVGLRYLGKETIKTKMGTFRCLKLEPILIVDRIFKSDDEMTMWVSDDENKIPLRIESGISVGKIRADLTEYSGLKNTFVANKLDD